MRPLSSAFEEGAPIPRKFTADGSNVSPPLEWVEAPADTVSFALICDDPDAPRGTWVHWVLFNIPAEKTGLPENVAPHSIGARAGKNDFGKLGYGGPAPPRGKPHRYYFKLYALDRTLDLAEGATKQRVESAMKNHIQAEAQLMGTYGRA
jgi:Raf kinase inhibitor-like YbhB/YbcL family protein